MKSNSTIFFVFWVMPKSESKRINDLFLQSVVILRIVLLVSFLYTLCADTTALGSTF